MKNSRVGRLLLVGLAVLLSVLTVQGNLVGNAGYEDAFTGSDQGNWIVWGGAERLDWQALSGSYALCFKGNWSGSDYAGAEQKVPVVAGADYELSLNQYWDNGFTAGKSELNVDWRDGNGTVLSRDTITLDLSGGGYVWQPVGPVELTAAAGAVEAEIWFDFGSIGSGGAYYIDDVSLVEEVVIPTGSSFFRCANGEILDGDGNPFLIRGLGVSGYLNPEGYMWGINRTEFLNHRHALRERIEDVVGATDAAAFWSAYRSNFLTQDDIDFMLDLGVNAVRLPFDYAMLSPRDQEGVFDEAGFQLLDAAIELFNTNGIYVILDMHSAPGGAASEASGDPEYTYWMDMGGWWQEHGIACLWEFNQEYYNQTGRTPASNQARAAAIWAEIAERYANDEGIIGYELINEPHLYDPALTNEMRAAFIQITDAIRQVDTNHILFVEGDMFAEHTDGLLPPWDGNMALAFHTYWKPNDVNQIQQYLDIRNIYNIPIWCSESGENSNPWCYEFVTLLENNNIGWTWWGWKKCNGYATGFSGAISSDHQYLIDNLWSGSVDASRFMSGLMDIASSLHSDNALLKPGYFEALFDPAGLFGNTCQAFATHNIPGTINCVDYDIGNQGVAYYDTVYKNEAYGADAGNKGYQYRSDGVDILTSSDGCGYKVGYTDSGEWMKYTIEVSSSRNRRVYITSTSAVNDSKVRLYVDGVALTGDITLPNTGGWDNWQETYIGRKYLSVGTHELKVQIVNGGSDLSSIRFR